MAKDLTGMSLEELVAYRKQIAQAANRQIRRLRAKGYEKGNALSKVAEPYLARTGNRRGFSERAKPFDIWNPYKETKAGVRRKTDAEIRAEQIRREKAEIGQIENFMEAKTYKISGIKEQRRKMKETYKKNYGVELTDELISTIFETEAFEWVRQTYGSQTVAELAHAINEGQATSEEIINRINELRQRYEQTKLDDFSVETLFEELGLEWKPEYRQSRKEVE